MRVDVLKFALAGGITGALCMSWITIASLIGVPGFLPYAKLIEQGYSFYGYSISLLGVLVGAFYGFVEVFVWIGIFVYIYNKLLNRKS